ncbi:flagellar hook-length control protein FliK [Clostridium sp. DL1XJH146]
MEVMAAINAQLGSKNSKSNDVKIESGDCKFSDLMSGIFKSEEIQDTKSVKVEGDTSQGDSSFIFNLDVEDKKGNEDKIDETKSLDDYIEDDTLNLASLQYEFNSTQKLIEISQEVMKITEKSSEITQKMSGSSKQTMIQGLSSIMQESNTLTGDTIVTTHKTNILNQHASIVAKQNNTVENYYINLNNSVVGNEIAQLDSVKSELQNILTEISNLDQNSETILLKEVENSIKDIISQIGNYEKIDTNKDVKQDSKQYLEYEVSLSSQVVNKQINEEIGNKINYLQDDIDNLVSNVAEFIGMKNDITDPKIQEIINVLQGNPENSISNTKEDQNAYDTIKNLQSRGQNKIEFKQNIAMDVNHNEQKNQEVNNYKNEFTVLNETNYDNEVNQVKIVEEKLISVIKELKVIQTNLSTIQNEETITKYNSATTVNQQYEAIVDLSRVNRIFNLQNDTIEIDSQKSISKEKDATDSNSVDKILNFNFDENNEEIKFIDKTLNNTFTKSENLKLNNLSFIAKDESTKDNLTEISDKDKPQVDNIKSTLQNLNIFNTTAQGNSNDLTISNINTTAEVQIENFDEVIKELEIKTDGIKNNEEMTMSVKLKPQELGELNIQIEKKDNEMIAKIIVSSNETKELIQKNMHLIKTSLENANVKIIEVNVNDKTSYANNFSFNSQNGENSRNNDFYNEENGNGTNSSNENIEELYTEDDKKTLSKSATMYYDNKINILT